MTGTKSKYKNLLFTRKKLVAITLNYLTKKTIRQFFNFCKDKVIRSLLLEIVYINSYSLSNLNQISDMTTLSERSSQFRKVLFIDEQRTAPTDRKFACK